MNKTLNNIKELEESIEGDNTEIRHFGRLMVIREAELETGQGKPSQITFEMMAALDADD